MALNLGQVVPFNHKHNVCNSNSTPHTFAPMESLKERRERMGLTQKEVGAACGKHFSHICHIERGNADPSLKVIVRLAEVLDLTPGKLVDMLVGSAAKSRAASVTDIQKARERRKRR